MKPMIFTAFAVALAAPALAQTTPAPTTPDASMAQPAPGATPMATPPAQTATDTSTTANAAGAAVPADGTYPMCTRTMTDHCTERSNAKGARLHSTPRG